MTDYTSLRVVDLKKLLAERSLPQAGNKTELVARLTQSDSSTPNAGSSTPNAGSSTPAAPAPSATPTPAIAPPAEDDIDWDDDPSTTNAAPSNPPAAAALAAGGQVPVANPVAVPNQTPAIDPAKTSDLSVTAPSATTDASSAAAPADAPSAPAPAEPEKPKADFSAHLPSTSLDHELALRKKRAEKFGIVESNEDAIRALERAKKFGGGAGELEGGGLKGLDRALPDGRPSRKRERGERGDGGSEGKRQDSRGVGERERNGGKGGRGERGQRRQGGSGGKVTDNPEEKAKAEKRAARFGAAA